MSIENNIQRIADALESIAAAWGKHVEQLQPADTTPKRTRGKKDIMSPETAAAAHNTNSVPSETITEPNTGEQALTEVVTELKSIGVDVKVVDAPAPAPAPAVTYTATELNEVLVAAFHRVGSREPIDALFKSYGAQSIRDLAPEKYAEVMEAAKKIGVWGGVA